MRSYARWVARAKPGDYVIALSGASASVPLIGRHLEVLGGFAALGVGGRRYVSGIVAGMAQARLSPGQRRAARRPAGADAERADSGVGRHRRRRTPRPTVALTSGARAAVEGGRAAAVRVPLVGALRRPPKPAARRLARPEHGHRAETGARARLHTRRRMGVRPAGVAGPRVDGPSRAARVGVPVSSVPVQPATPLAAPDDRRQGCDRVGTGQRSAVRR